MYDIYSQSNDDRLRFTLGLRGDKMLYVVGLNPSTATQEKSDTTVAKVQVVARQAGYTGFAMLNLYPVRATDFKTLPTIADKNAIDSNLAAIEHLLAQEQTPTIWAAWGQSILARPYFRSSAKAIANQLAAHNPRWVNFGALTADRHPRHPSRLSYSWSFSEFALTEYVARIDA